MLMEKAAFDIGSAVHLLTLEPEREDELIRVVLDCERGDNDWPQPSRTLIYLTQEELALSRRVVPSWEAQKEPKGKICTSLLRFRPSIATAMILNERLPMCFVNITYPT